MHLGDLTDDDVLENSACVRKKGVREPVYTCRAAPNPDRVVMLAWLGLSAKDALPQQNVATAGTLGQSVARNVIT